MIMYGSPPEAIPVPDRTLAHLKLVMVAKLRRGETFTLSVTPEDEAAGYGRQTIWISPDIPLRFVFDDPVGPSINKLWLERLAVSANSTGGLLIVPEPDWPPRPGASS